MRAPGAHVILVTVDTLRADHLGADGSSPGPPDAPGAWRVATPHMDALAAEGVRFTNAATTVPFTLPAHSSIMTGTYPPGHGVRENVGYSLDQRLPTLAGILGQAGYTTAAFVSAFVLDSRWGIGRGFDVYYDLFQTEHSETQDGAAQINLGEVQRDGAETVATALGWLDAYLAAPSSQPVFLWLHLFDPHEPYTPPEPYKSRYPDHPYGAEVAYTDELVGRFRAGLDERGLLDDAVVVLTGDHGEGLGEHGESFHGFFVYDSTVRVPLIVRLPPSLDGGRDAVVKDAVSHVDLLPTLLDVLGLDAPEGVQGRSLLPLLAGNGGESERAVYSESFYALYHYGWSPLRALRAGPLKYIEAPRPEVYDLAADRGEATNLLAERRSDARDLQRRLEELASSIARPDDAGGGETDLDEETLRQLEALGYLAGRGEISGGDDFASHRQRADPKDKVQVHQSIMWAQTFIGRGRDEEAERRLLRALERDPGMVDAHQMLGNIASRRQDFAAAAEHFRRALELQPDHQVALYGLATAYRKLGRDDEALVGYQRLAEIAPHDSKAVIAMTAVFVRQERLGEALKLLEDATAEPRAPARLHSQHGELLLRLGRPNEAAGQLRLAIAKNPELVTPFFHLAKIAEGEGKLDDAAALYEAVLARRPNLYPALLDLGRLYGQRGETDRQRDLYEGALEADPDFIRGYFALARWLLDHGSDGDLERAEKLTRDGLERDTERRTGGFGYFLLADVLQRQGRPAEARQAAAEGRALRQARRQQGR